MTADVHGCLRQRDREPEEQDSVLCTVGSLTEFDHLHGQVRLPTGQPVVCGWVAIRGGDESDDWLAAIGTETFKSASFSLEASDTCFHKATSCAMTPPTPESCYAGWARACGGRSRCGRCS